jgi:hypothetical protein
MTGGWPDHWLDWTNPDAIRALLAAGADPDARLTNMSNTPLHHAVWELRPDVAVVDLLLASGADVNARNVSGATPLWYAVRRGFRDGVVALLAAGADPWVPQLAGRSAGRVALDGPLADLFAPLPGAPAVPEAQRRAQHEADALIDFYTAGHGFEPHFSIAFVSGVPEDEVARRAEVSDGEEGVFVGTVPDGDGVVLYAAGGIAPDDADVARRVTAGGGVLASMFDNPAGGGAPVSWWRDGTLLAYPTSYSDPTDRDPEQAWLCRFGDRAHSSSTVARNLALMTMLTGVRVPKGWLPERVLRVAPL